MEKREMMGMKRMKRMKEIRRMVKTRRIIAIALTIIMLVAMTAMYATAAEDEAAEEAAEATEEATADTAEATAEDEAAEDETITVSLRVEGIEKPMYYNSSITVAAGTTVAELLTAVNEMEDSPEIKISESAFGVYVSEIDGLAEFAYGDMSGWSYRVNDESPTFGINLYELKDGDEVVSFFGDPFGIGMQYPRIDISKLLSDGVIRFTSMDATYDEEWNEIRTENPVAAAIVTLDREIYTTDEDGQITIADKTGLSGFHTLQIEKYDEDSGVPTVLRFAPDRVMYVPFADTAYGAWYSDAVMFCVGEGYFVGMDAAQNLFAPLENMSMVQLFTVLSRIAGVDPALTTGAQWYKAPLEWALENGLIIPEDELSEEEQETLISDLSVAMANVSVKRENFIYLFYRTAEIVGAYDMTLRADITGAADYDDIYEDCREAISWAVAAGIIRGTSDSGLVIEPGFMINRATVCQMLYNYYN